MHSKLTLITLILSFFTFMSCEQVIEEYLYNKYDDDYTKVIAAATAQCKDDSDALEAVAKAKDFSNFSSGKVYKIVFTGEQGVTSGTFYINTYSVSSTKMVFQIVNSANNSGPSSFDTRSKTIEFTSTQAQTIYDDIAAGVCTSDPDTSSSYYSSSTLDKDDYLTFTHDRYTENDDDDYDQRSGSYTVHEDYPIFLYLWNSTVKQTERNGTDDTESTVFSFTKTEITDFTDDCDGEADCDFSGSATSKTCDTTVSSIYTSDDPERELIMFSSCSK